MSRQTKTDSEFGLSAISVEGGLISPDKLTAIASTTPDAKAATSYECPKGVSLRDEIARYFRIAQAEWQSFTRFDQADLQSTTDFVKNLLENGFGFCNLSGPQKHHDDGHVYNIALEAKGGRVPIVIAPTIDNQDAFKQAVTLFGDGAQGSISKRRPDALLQEWLNASEPALWGLVFVGDRLRLMRDNASFTRPAYIEADLGAIFRDEMFPDFSALWLLIHASRFGKQSAAVTDCALERWREEGVQTGTIARDRLRDNVEEALLSLGQGFLEANPDLRDKLDSGALSEQAWFEQLLRIVYRLIFLAVSESRELLHSPDALKADKTLYRDGYGFAHMRKRSTRRSSRDPHYDAFEGTKIVFKGLESGQARLGLPPLGGLFAAGLTPDLNTARISNRYFLKAVFRLSFLMENKARVRINWRDMATEELGSVYEGLLEIVPTRTEQGRKFTFARGEEARGNTRKTTGSYYTPDSLVQALLDSTLDPVLDRAQGQGGAEAILALDIIDPACGSGHFLLGAARRMATRVATLRDNENPDFQHALRDVVTHCIYGVDRNPMAVELARVALWIEAIEPGKPLSFLEANIRCGDSLMGVFNYQMLREGLPDEAFAALTGDDKNVAKEYARINKEQREGQATKGGLIASLRAPAEIIDGAEKLLSMPENTLQEIKAKSKALEALMSSGVWWTLKTACDMYVAAFLMPKTGDIPDARAATMPIPTTEAIWRTIRGGDIRSDIQAACIDLAESARAFHWPLEFPAQMATGGFDVVLGNPPWERIKLQEQEFFAARDADIASAANKAERGKLIKALKQTNPALAAAFRFAKRTAEAASLFARKTGRFPLTGTGDVNTYALFAEHFSRLARQVDGAPLGHAGVVVPTGIATDSSTSAFFGDLVAGNRLMALYDFENRQGLFPGVHRSYKFSILAIGPARAAKFAAYLLNTGMLAHEDRQISLTVDDFTLFNPNTRTAPLFRARADKALTRKLYEAAPVLIRERPDHPQGDANPWGITFQTLFHMSNDSKHFRTAAQLSAMGFERDGADWRGPDGEHYLPLFEAKMIHHYDHRYGSYTGLDARPKDGSLPEVTDAMRASPDFEADPWYWVPAEETELRVARVPQRLKAYLRKENAEGCLKVLAEWVLSTLDPDDLGAQALARTAPLATARLREVLGERALARGILGATFPTWLGKVAPGARKMARETPLSDEDLLFIKQGPKPALDLARALIMRKQPRWLMGWRDIARATDERTVIASVFPKVGTGDTLLLMHPKQPARVSAALIANLCSIPLDYLCRQKIGGTHLKYNVYKQNAVLAPHQFTDRDLAFLTPRVLELTYTSHALRPWAEDLGHTGAPFLWNPERRALLQAELDAFFARKYGLGRDELRYILDPADIKGEDYPSETFRGLKRNEMEKYGEYRTGHLVLAAWDRLSIDGTFRNMDLLS